MSRIAIAVGVASWLTALPACTSAPPASQAPSGVDTPPAAHVVTTIPVPGYGPVEAGIGSLWVVDIESSSFEQSGQPNVGFLVRIDPVANEVLDRVPGVMGGGGIAVGNGAVWLGSPAFDRLLRVDLRTGTVTRVRTGSSNPEMPFQPVLAGGLVWVANHRGGTVARIDPATGTLVDPIRWGDPGPGGPMHLATDGASVWVAATRDPTVIEIDVRTGTVRARLDLGPSGTCGGLALGAGSLWVASGIDPDPTLCGAGQPTLNRVDVATGAIDPIELPDEALDVEYHAGDVWVLTGTISPDPHMTALVRIDPETNQVVGRLSLSGQPDPTDPMTAGLGALWVRRVHDGLVRIESD
jgi:hypothetical protein